MANANFTCVLEAWNDGKVLYGRMHYYRSGSYYYQDTSFPNPTMNLGGTTYTDTDFGNRVRSGIYVGDVYSTTFSRTVAGSGDRTVTWSAGSGQRSDFAGSWSKTVYIPESYTPPTGLGADNIVRGIEEFTANVYISGWGQGSGTRYRELQCWTLGMTEPRRYQPSYGDSLSGNITVSNSSNGSLTIRGNTMYTLGVYASNGQANTGSISFGNYTTRAYAPTVSVEQLTDTTAVASYTLQSDGGQYAKNMQYSLDGGTTWVTGATVNTGSATTGSFAITGLTPETSYTMKTRVSTNAGETNGADVTFKTCPSYEPHGDFYGSVNDVSKQINNFYGSVETTEIAGVTGEIRAGGAGNVTDFDSTTFWLAAESQVDFSKTLSYVRAQTNSSGSKATLYLGYTDNTESSLSGVTTFSSCSNYGITGTATTSGSDYIDLTLIYSTAYESTTINKLYGSVGGESKLIHQSFGHYKYPKVPKYGIVYYKTNASDPDSEIKSVELQSVAEFDSLCNSSLSWTASVGDGSVTVSSNSSNVIVGVEIGTEITSISNYFLNRCSSFNQPLTIPNNVTSIGHYFLYYCTSFNQSLVISNNIGAIGAYFLSGCLAFNQPFVIPNIVTSISHYFLTSCSAFNQPLTLPDSITSIGMGFLAVCYAFNQSLTLPANLTSIGSQFINGCDNMTGTVNVGSLNATIANSNEYTFSSSSSTAPCYATGITISGANRAAWISRFPNSSSYPYRKLVDAGY